MFPSVVTGRETQPLDKKLRVPFAFGDVQFIQLDKYAQNQKSALHLRYLFRQWYLRHRQWFGDLVVSRKWRLQIV